MTGWWVAEWSKKMLSYSRGKVSPIVVEHLPRSGSFNVPRQSKLGDGGSFAKRIRLEVTLCFAH